MMFHCYISLHPVSLRALKKSFGLLHPVSEFFLYILIVSFVTKQKWVDKKKKMMFHSYISLHPVS